MECGYPSDYQLQLQLQLHGELITFQSDLCGLRVAPLSLSPSCVTRKKAARKKGPRVVARSTTRGHFFLAVFFRVTHDRLSERGGGGGQGGVLSRSHDSKFLISRIRNNKFTSVKFTKVTEKNLITLQ